MSDETVTQRVSTEGADPLTLAGVNDGNLIELYVDADHRVWRDDPASVANSDPLTLL